MPGVEKAVATESSEPPIFNPEAALVRLDGDVELFGMLVALYMQDSRTLLGQLGDSLERGEAREAQRAAHSLKGLAANFDGVRASSAAAKIELAAKSEDLEAAAALRPELEKQIEQLRGALASYRP